MKIKNITRVAPRTVYAIQTSSATFIADGLAHHNCYACNMLYNGQPSSYAKRLRIDYDKDIVELLEARRKKITHDFNYQEIIDIYTEKLMQMGMSYLI